ncbi:MAG: glycosyltransferase family 4 protein [Janthinobacterium lividum]
MRICFVSRRYFPAISGMSVYARNLLHELVGAGHEVTMISQFRGDAFGRSVYGGGPPPPVAGVRVVGLEQVGEQGTGDFERDIEAMVEAIRREHARAPFDVLHAQYGYPTGWAVLLASRALEVANVVSIQGGDGHWVGSCCETHRLAMTRVLDHAGAVLIGCRSFADEVVGRLGTEPSRFTIVPGAVDVERFTPGDGRAPGLGFGAARDLSAAPVLLYHGRVDRRKGALDLLDAARVLADEGVGFSLVYSGIGPDFDAVAERIVALGLSERVRMTGHVAYEDVPAVYREADVFVSPTYAEGFSNTILEAMASGLACVSCRAVGVVDCLRHGENGLLSEPGDVAGLADSLRQVIADRALLGRLAAAGLEECRRVYSWRSVGRQIMDVYAQVVRAPVDRGFVEALPVTACRFRAEPHLL